MSRLTQYKIARRVTRLAKPHGVLWKGKSPFNGAPIVAVATHTTREDKCNGKTGPMVQVYILNARVDPVSAIQRGADDCACGKCAMRGDGFSERGCYVQIGNGPQSVFTKYASGGYDRVSPSSFQGYKVRWGAYGDPAMLPEPLVRAINASALGWTGYTHQWKHAWARWTLGTFMASADTLAIEHKLRAKGHGTFRAMARDGSDQGDTEVCLNEVDGTQCIDCMRCDGSARAIGVKVHGAGAVHVPAELFARRAREKAEKAALASA